MFQWWDPPTALLDRPDFDDYLEHRRDPGDMVEELVRVTPADRHPFRTAYPEGIRGQLREFESQVWDETT
ncbi:hypothetical protein ACFY03_26650 [Micromonospora chersina]|uniref:hypothetical protein n=1 Tax=Micromonospora chersina TaxID=47854 RepID=UPI0036776945